MSGLPVFPYRSSLSRQARSRGQSSSRDKTAPATTSCRSTHCLPVFPQRPRNSRRPHSKPSCRPHRNRMRTTTGSKTCARSSDGHAVAMLRLRRLFLFLLLQMFLSLVRVVVVVEKMLFFLRVLAPLLLLKLIRIFHCSWHAERLALNHRGQLDAPWRPVGSRGRSVGLSVEQSVLQVPRAGPGESQTAAASARLTRGTTR